MTSSSYPLTVKQPVQPNTSHTSPLDPSGSSGPNNSNHQKPPLSSQKSSVKSSLPSSKINSSSSSSSQKPIPASSLKRLSAGTSNGLKAEAGGKIKPIQAKKLTVSSHNLASNGIHIATPNKERQNGAPAWEIQRLIISQGFQMNELIIFLDCTYENMFVEGQKPSIKERIVQGKLVDFYQ